MKISEIATYTFSITPKSHSKTALADLQLSKIRHFMWKVRFFLYFNIFPYEYLWNKATNDPISEIKKTEEPDITKSIFLTWIPNPSVLNLKTHSWKKKKIPYRTKILLTRRQSIQWTPGYTFQWKLISKRFQ